MRTVYIHFIVLVEFRVSLRVSMGARSEVQSSACRCSQNPDWECVLGTESPTPGEGK